MADWRKLSIEIILAEGKLNEKMVKILKKELRVEGAIERDELNFLIDLRNAALKKAKGKLLLPMFERFFFKALEYNILAHGAIANKEAILLRDVLLSDGRVDKNEVKFLKKLKREVIVSSPVFQQVFDDCLTEEQKMGR